MEDLTKYFNGSGDIVVMRQFIKEDNDKIMKTTDMVDLYNFDIKKVEQNYENEFFNIYAYDMEYLTEHISFDIDVKYGFDSYNFQCFYQHDEVIFFGKSLFNKFKIDVQEQHINEFLLLIIEMVNDNVPNDFWSLKRNQN